MRDTTFDIALHISPKYRTQELAEKVTMSRMKETSEAMENQKSY